MMTIRVVLQKIGFSPAILVGVAKVCDDARTNDEHICALILM
jgi:hypothetical protein